MIKKRLLICSVLSLGCMASVANADVLRTVALSGDAAPGTSANFSGFTGIDFNNAGQIAFSAYLAGSEVSLGIWSEGSGSLALVVRTGNRAPGTDDNFVDLFSPLFNDAGQTAFVGFPNDLVETESIDRGIWSDVGGSLKLITRTGSRASGTNGRFSFFGEPIFNDVGQTAFYGFLTGTSVDSSNEEGIWLEEGGELTLVAREGNSAPGTSSNYASFSYFDYRNLFLNDAGQIVFHGHLDEPGIRGGLKQGLWLAGGGSSSIVAIEGSRAPGTSEIFSGFSGPALNEAGQSAFSGFLAGPGVTRSNDQGIWSEGSGLLALIARTGNLAPGTNASFSFLRDPVLNDAGQLVFQGRLTGSSNGWGIWSNAGDSLELVALEGSNAPGTNLRFSFLSGPILNDSGQVAISGFLNNGSGNRFSGDSGVWAQDLSGELILISREGDLLDIDDGPGTDFRTISRVGLSGFNDLGQVAFSATFTDGTSGIFVSNLVAVPEPSTLALLAMASLAMLRRKPRR